MLWWGAAEAIIVGAAEIEAQPALTRVGALVSDPVLQSVSHPVALSAVVPMPEA